MHVVQRSRAAVARVASSAAIAGEDVRAITTAKLAVIARVRPYGGRPDPSAYAGVHSQDRSVLRARGEAKVVLATAESSQVVFPVRSVAER